MPVEFFCRPKLVFINYLIKKHDKAECNDKFW